VLLPQTGPLLYSCQVHTAAMLLPQLRVIEQLSSPGLLQPGREAMGHCCCLHQCLSRVHLAPHSSAVPGACRGPAVAGGWGQCLNGEDLFTHLAAHFIYSEALGAKHPWGPAAAP